MLSDPAVYTTFEKSIHLKASHPMRNLDDDKVALVAQLARVMVLNNGDLLYSSDTKVEFVHVIVDGTMEMTIPKMNVVLSRNRLCPPQSNSTTALVLEQR